MTTVSTFFGIVIQMFWRERALLLTMEWAADHRVELMKDWTVLTSLQVSNLASLRHWLTHHSSHKRHSSSARWRGPMERISTPHELQKASEWAVPF